MAHLGVGEEVKVSVAHQGVGEEVKVSVVHLGVGEEVKVSGKIPGGIVSGYYNNLVICGNLSEIQNKCIYFVCNNLGFRCRIGKINAIYML